MRCDFVAAFLRENAARAAMEKLGARFRIPGTYGLSQFAREAQHTRSSIRVVGRIGPGGALGIVRPGGVKAAQTGKSSYALRLQYYTDTIEFSF